MAFAFAALPLNRIRVGKRKRKPSRDVSGLAASMSQLGLLQPIHVTDDYRLIAGYHRLAAAKLLKWDAIDAYVFTGTALDAELIQIDENLQRVDLTVAERSEHLARRKAIYEAQHPETKAGKAGGKASGIARGTSAESAFVQSFTADTAAKTGRGRRTIEEEVSIGEHLTPAVMEAAKGSAIADCKGALADLAALPADTQESLIAQIADEKATSKLIRDEIRKATPKTKHTRTKTVDAMLRQALAQFDKWAQKWRALDELSPIFAARKGLR